MGDCCNNPNCGMDDTFFQRQNQNIELNGYTYIAVAASEDGPGFIYTVGLSERGRDDLIFVGDFAPPVLNYLAGAAQTQVQGKVLKPGRIDPVWNNSQSEEEIEDIFENVEGPLVNGTPMPMYLVPAADKLETYALSVARRLDSISSDLPPRLMQVVMPDMNGTFPWEEGYDWLDQDITTAPQTA